MSLSTIAVMLVIGLEYGNAWTDNYFDSWYTYLAFAYGSATLAGKSHIWKKQNEKSALTVATLLQGEFMAQEIFKIIRNSKT